MSQQPSIEWDAKRRSFFAWWLNAMLELNAVEPVCHPAAEPRTGKPGVVVKWHTFGRTVEYYHAYSGEASILRRDGGPSEFAPLAQGVRDALDPLRRAIAWMEGREGACPPPA